MTLWADMTVKTTTRKNGFTVGEDDHVKRRGMVLPFRPLSLAFNHVNYSIDMPAVSHLFVSLQCCLIPGLGNIMTTTDTDNTISSVSKYP